MLTESSSGEFPPDLTIAEAFVRAQSPRRVLIYAPLAYSTPHYETDLEIAQRHLALGDEVEVVACDGELPTCQLNPRHETLRCVQCVSRGLHGPARLSAKVRTVSLLSALTAQDQTALTVIPRQFTDQRTLRQYQFHGFDAGMATLSSLIDFIQSLNVDVRAHAEIIHRTLQAAASSYLALRRILQAKPYDRVYIYNGRWSMVRSAVRACEHLGVAYYTHERGADFRKFALFRDTLPHDKAAFRERVAAAWDQARLQPAAVPLAETFFRDRRQRVEKNWFSFTKQQESGRVPSDWNRSAKRLVCFTSSEFEFAAIHGDSTGRIYPSQAAGVRRIAELLIAASPTTHLWVRIHPNDKAADAVARWREFAGGLANVTLVMPDESVDSYALLEGAERILTFGSTMAIESTFWGKVSICADVSFWDGLDTVYEATNEAHLLELLTSAALTPKPRERALKYGYYLNTFGDPFEYFVTDKISDYEFQSPFRGHGLKPDYDDLRQRLIALFNEGALSRATTIARLCAEFKPEDPVPHSILVLALTRRGALADALTALEYAAAKSSPARLEEILKHTGNVVLDATSRVQQTSPADFQNLGRRLGAVMLRATAFAPIGRKLIEMAQRASETPTPEVAEAR